MNKDEQGSTARGESRMRTWNPGVDNNGDREAATVVPIAQGGPVEVTARAITLASAAVVLLGGCNTNATAGPPHNGPDNPVMTPAGRPAPMAAPSGAVPPPDPEGNPACPLSDAWGQAPTDNGIFITYWENQDDYVTALVRTSLGTDYAKSASIDAVQQPLIFDFPDVNAATVREVLITTNVERCFATPDPATSGR